MTMPLILTARQMKDSDREATARYGVPGVVLMENAGRGVAEFLAARFALAETPVAVVCGGGNNGGDGFVIARHLALAGAQVAVCLTVDPAKIVGDAALFLRALDACPGVKVKAVTATTVNEWQPLLTPARILVDAIFGTGLRADVTGAPAAAIAAMNAAPGFRVAVDVPSGLDADTGAIRGVCVKADATVTMACRKPGLVLDADLPIGELHVVGLGAPVSAPDDGGPYLHWLTHDQIRRINTRLPQRTPSAHKGTRGHLLVIAGSSGKTGAAWLAGRAAARGGAGLVTLASTAPACAALDAKVIESMTAPFSDGDDADPASYDRLQDLVTKLRIRAVALGPGIPTGSGMKALVRRLAAEFALPMVLDADALNHLGTDASALLRDAAGPRVLTPHPGEMAHLLGVTVGDVQAARLQAVRRLAAAARAVVVLKGARTLVAAPDGTAYVNPTANPSLATGGSGDALTGLVGALLVQGLSSLDAALSGVFIHGLAAADACGRLGLDNLVAGDLPDAIARVLAAK